MSWKARKRKAFLRYIEWLKEVPIYLIDKYILVDESYLYYKRNRMIVDYKTSKRKRYKEYLAEDKIKSAFDFDNYFNPDLTLDMLFEKDEDKIIKTIKEKLIEIGERWDERLKDKFPGYKYTLVVYFNHDNMEYFLDFKNGVFKAEDGNNTDIVYL